ncbi:Cyclase family protein [Sulfidibacter corallicola]|uniref:Cyclase family protein n=1 Tax=Sulfidibacter corallicola TaxID=2818388 RepID=A0A8A4TVG2_SULCO|nr:cyclase family protein [Sulfidibacter corallicola]QTD53121.1 cyclase family protein [Sulfidibacter corallicola]
MTWLVPCFHVLLLFGEPTISLQGNRIVDLSHDFSEKTLYWPTAQTFTLQEDFKGTTDKGFHYEANTFKAAEHGGTHLDAPNHFAAGRWSSEQIPLDRLIGAAVVIDVRDKCAENRDYQVQTSDFEAWEKKNGRLPKGVIVLLHTGMGKHWPDAERYLGTAERGPQAVPKLHFPGLHPQAAEWLVTHRSIHAIGLDTPSIDYGQSTLFESHQILFKANIPAFENVANLDQLPAKGASVIALPMKIKGGSGGPLRIIALLP